MRLVLDTQILVWADLAPERLGAVEDLLADADRRLLSAVSVWELAIKQGLGKVDLRLDVRSWHRSSLAQLAAQPLDITASHAAAVEDLPLLHRDPFDRLLLAQAQQEDAVLLTADRTLAAYGDVVRVVW